MTRAFPHISPWRLNLLRAGYLLLVAGLGPTIWPVILRHAHPWELMHGVAVCMLGALSAVALLGLRYPLRMLPLLFFEMAWKAIWLIVVALPLFTTHRLDPDTAETAAECLMGVIFIPLIPWDYVLAAFARAPADPWRRPPERRRPARVGDLQPD